MNKNFTEIEKLYVENNNYYYIEKEDNIPIKLLFGTEFKYKGAFGLNEDILSKIHPNLAKYTPYHHAIYIDNGEILHFTGGHNNYDPRNATIVKDTIFNFENTAKKRNSPIYVNYNNNIDNKENVLKRCDEVLGEKNYCIITNNCEHLVNYCITGIKKSDQVEGIVKDLSVAGFNYFLNKMSNYKKQS